MTRRHVRRTRAELLDRLPRAFRPKLVPDQVRDLALAHVVNLDAIATGQAGEDILWQQLGGTFTWSRVAELLGMGAPEMAEQVRLMEQVVQRFRATGRVLFTGPEYQLAKHGLQVMDLLAALVDRPTAIAAASWGENRMNHMAVSGLTTKEQESKS